MKCSKCQNEATTHLYQNINGQVTESWLCSECAEKMGVGALGGFGGFSDLGGFNAFDSLLGSIFGQPATHRTLSAPAKCSVCGSSFADIAKRGRMGCSQCYQQFEAQLRPSLGRIHGSAVHKGKRPGGATPPKAAASPSAAPTQKAVHGKAPAADKASQIASLRTQLKAAVAREEYEKAAQLRDRIKELEG